MPLRPLKKLKILELFWLGDFCFFECKRDKNLTCSSILSPFRTPFAYFFKKNPRKIVRKRIIIYFCTLNNRIFIIRTMKKQYQRPDLLIVGNFSPISVITTSGNGIQATNPGYSANTGGGFSQDESSSNAPANRSIWDE